MSDIFQRQIAPQDATGTLPFARPDAFGAGAAAAIGGAAANAARDIAINRAIDTRLERDKQATAASLQFARIQEEASEYALAQQSEAGLGGEGYTRSIEAFLQEKETAFLGSIGDDRVRQVMAERFGRWRSSAKQSAQSWEAGESVKLAVSNYQEVTNIRANRAARAESTQDFQQLISDQRLDTEMMEGVPANTRQNLLREGIKEIAIGFIQGRPPAERKELLKSGLFDVLDRSIVERLEAGADVDLRAEARAAEERQRADRAVIADQLERILDDLGDGLPVASVDLAEAEALARANGFEDEATRLFDGRTVNDANREFETAGFVAIDQEVKRLNRKIAEDGNKASRAAIVRRDHLAELRNKRRAMIENDPAEFASRLGIAWEPIALDDPKALMASVEARQTAARATAAAAGMPVQVLTESEVDFFKANMSTPEGRDMLLKVAEDFGPDARTVMRQVAPEEPLLTHLVGLGPRNRGYAIEGQALLDGKVFSPPSDLTDLINERLGRTLEGYSSEAKVGVLETTRALYAFHANKSGDDGSVVNESLLGVVLDRALGHEALGAGSGDGPGGLAQFNGNDIVLPSAMTADEFTRRMFNIGSTRGMYWGDRETPVTAEQLREGFRPVSIGGTRYQFAGPGGTWVLRKDGSRAVLDIGKVRPKRRPAQNYEEALERARASAGE